MWPWNKLRLQREEIRVLKAQLAACGMAAHGFYGSFTGEQYSQSLVAVKGLQAHCEKIEKLLATTSEHPLPPRF